MQDKFKTYRLDSFEGTAFFHIKRHPRKSFVIR